MSTAILSPEFQVAIPPAMCESLGIRPGQVMQVIQYDNRIEFVPVRPMREAFGMLQGIDTTIEREPDRL